MDPYQRDRFIGLGAVGLAVLSLLMLTAVGTRSLPGTTRSLGLSWTIDVIQVMQVGVGVLIIGAVLWSLVSRRLRREDDEPKRRASVRKQSSWLVLLVIGAALALLVWLIPRPEPAVLDERSPDFAISEVDFFPVENVGDAWPLLVLIAGTLMAALAVNRLTRPEPGVDDEIDPAGLIADTLSDALDRLSWTDDPRAVIIKAYHDIERELAVAGMPRRSSEAPREYLDRILIGAPMEQRSIIRLTDLFEQARFSEHEMTEDDRASAIDAMEAVRADLSAPAP